MKYIFKRFCSALVVLFFTSIVIFLIIHLIPGDPATIFAGAGATADQVEAVKISMGLDKPLATQYLTWINGLFHGNLGTSLSSRDPILPVLAEKLGNTLILSLSGIILAVLVGLSLGIVSALKHNTLIDVLSMIVAIIGISMPIFWIGMLLVIVFSINLGWLPVTGNDTFLSYLLPSITIALNSTAVITRMTRSSVLEVLGEDYVVTAVAKGLKKRTINLVHVLKNAMIPIITTIGMQFGYLMGGAVLTETVFVYPGLGRYLVDSIGKRDYPAVQAAILALAVIFIVINFLVDSAYYLLDPKLKEE